MSFGIFLGPGVLFGFACGTGIKRVVARVGMVVVRLMAPVVVVVLLAVVSGAIVVVVVVVVGPSGSRGTFS